MPLSVTASMTYWPGTHFGLAGGVPLVEMDVRRLDGQLAAVRHGVARIDGEIQDRDFELVGIGMRAPEPPASTVSIAICSPSVRRSRSDMPVTRRPTSTASARAAAGARTRAGAGSAIRRAARRAWRCSAERCSRSASSACSREMALQRFEIADDDGQKIVEVVRDAAGELADAFHLLRLAQRARRRRAAR